MVLGDKILSSNEDILLIHARMCLGGRLGDVNLFSFNVRD
jgi:hypothetical protein